MARDGRKLELYEILAAKRAKGKMPAVVEPKQSRQSAPQPEPPKGAPNETPADRPGVIVDDAVAHMMQSAPPTPIPAPAPETQFPRPAKESRGRYKAEPKPDYRAEQRRPLEAPEQPEPQPAPEPPPPPRPRSRREVVFALDTAFIFFTMILALVGSSYFLGYKRGQEERPVGLAGLADTPIANSDTISIRDLEPAPRVTVKPSDQDYTLVLRTEPVSDDLPERLELELAEAIAKGRQKGAGDIPGLIFRTGSNDPRYVLAVGLGKGINDPELERLRGIFRALDGVTLSREARPYAGCLPASVRELGTLVY